MEKMIINEETCPKCHGSGRVHDVAGALCTLGVTFIFGLISPEWKERCPVCKGKGIVQRKTIIKE